MEPRMAFVLSSSAADWNEESICLIVGLCLNTGEHSVIGTVGFKT